MEKTSDLRIGIANTLRVLSGAFLHALVWWAAFYYVAVRWQQPYLIWTQVNGFGIPDWLGQVLKLSDLILRFPYPSLGVLALGAACDIYIMLQLRRAAIPRLLSDIWFVGILAIPTLGLSWLGASQIHFFLERVVDPYSAEFASPEVAAEVSEFDGRWSLAQPQNVNGNADRLAGDFEIIHFNRGRFEWTSQKMGIAVGSIDLESLRDPKQIQFVAMQPDSRWTIRTGIYRFDQDQLILMLPRWDSLSLPPPLDFEWDDSRYETLRLVREKSDE